MADVKTINVYCDESCHLERDRIPVMVWGAVSCERRYVPDLSERIRAIKAEYGFKSDFEAKWTKVSPAKADFYLALTDFFLADDRLRFRGLVAPDKGQLDHERFDQSHNDWYYKVMLSSVEELEFIKGLTHCLEIEACLQGNVTQPMGHTEPRQAADGVDRQETIRHTNRISSRGVHDAIANDRMRHEHRICPRLQVRRRTEP